MQINIELHSSNLFLQYLDQMNDSSQWSSQLCPKWESQISELMSQQMALIDTCRILLRRLNVEFVEMTVPGILAESIRVIGIGDEFGTNEYRQIGSMKLTLGHHLKELGLLESKLVEKQNEKEEMERREFEKVEFAKYDKL